MAQCIGSHSGGVLAACVFDAQSHGCFAQLAQFGFRVGTIYCWNANFFSAAGLNPVGDILYLLRYLSLFTDCLLVYGTVCF